MTDTIKTTPSGIRYTSKLTDTTPGNVVVWDPYGLFKEWHLSEIYQGPDKIGKGNIGRFVPNVGNKVWDEDLGTMIVEELDPTTLIPKLRAMKKVPNGGVDDKNLLLGVGPAHPQEGYFVYVDPVATPTTIAFDGMACFYQAESRYIRIFRGSIHDDPNARCISAWYDQSGLLVDDKIPLEKLESTLHEGDPNTFWIPKVGAVTEIPEKGEVLSAVCYNDNDKVVSISLWIVNYGVAFRESFSGNKTIESIELVGPYVKPNNELILPVGTLVSTGTMSMCKVTYSDGTTNLFNIDGAKVKISGEKGYVSSTPGVPYPVNLIYTLDRTEQMKGSSGNNGTFHVVTYIIKTDTKVSSYGMKLFTYPEWVSDKRGYRLRHFMQSIDRDAVYEVTDFIEIGATSAPWDPLLYGTKQRITFALDISKVDPRYTDYRHVQTTWISLLTDGITHNRNPWLIQFEPGQSPEYGYNLECKLSFTSSQVWETDITCGFKDQTDWLQHLYYDTIPLRDISSENVAPAPTHFIVVIEGVRYRRKMDQWNMPFITKSGSHPGELCVIHWVKEVNGVDLNLATSGLIIRQYNK